MDTNEGGVTRLVARVFFLLCVALELLNLALVVWGKVATEEGVLGALILVTAAIGALVATRRPGNVIGWLLLLLALSAGLSALTDGYVSSTEARESLTFGVEAAWISNWLWYIWLSVGVVFVPLLFPSGRLPSSRWRPVFWLAVVAVLLGMTSTALGPVGVSESESGDLVQVHNPLGVRIADEILDAVEAVSLIALLGSFACAGASLVIRYQRSAGVEREQLKWFGLVAGLMLVAISVAGASSALPEEKWADDLGSAGWTSAILLLFVGLPTAIGIAILRYHLYDIDYIINRTLVYGFLTAFLAGLYAASIPFFRFIFEDVSGQTSEGTIVLTTLVLAAAFTPAKARLQALVDRYVGQPHDPVKDLSAYSEHVQQVIEAIDPDEAARSFLDQAVHSLDARDGAVFLARNGVTYRAASSGEWDDLTAIRVSLRYNGTSRGHLVLAQRGGGQPYAEDELVALQSAADLVGHAIGVMQEFTIKSIGPKRSRTGATS
jgi:hypothetical protein